MTEHSDQSSVPQFHERRRYFCSSCGIVREGGPTEVDEPRPWCRHGDPTTVATRMDLIGVWHPLYGEALPTDWPTR